MLRCKLTNDLIPFIPLTPGSEPNTQTLLQRSTSSTHHFCLVCLFPFSFIVRNPTTPQSLQSVPLQRHLSDSQRQEVEEALDDLALRRRQQADDKKAWSVARRRLFRQSGSHDHHHGSKSSDEIQLVPKGVAADRLDSDGFKADDDEKRINDDLRDLPTLEQNAHHDDHGHGLAFSTGLYLMVLGVVVTCAEFALEEIAHNLAELRLKMSVGKGGKRFLFKHA